MNWTNGWIFLKRRIASGVYRSNGKAATLCFSFLCSNINGDVMATFRLVFRVSKVQQYSDNFVQDLLRVGLNSVLHGKSLEVPDFGEINTIILLGRKTLLSSVDCPF